MATIALRTLFGIPKGNPELMRSQLRAFSRQIPLLYFILIVNSDALAWTHYGVAPLGRTLIFPAVLTVACAARVRMWLRIRPDELNDAVLARRLRVTIAVTGGFGAVFLGWSLSLYPYGDAYAQSHVAFYIGITVVSCIFCLMHLRPAALLLTCIVVVPFTVFFFTAGHPVFTAIAINMLLVCAAMVYILLVYSRDFASMIAYQKQLILKHEAEIERERANADAERAAQREILKHAGRFEVAINNMLQGLCMFDADRRLIVCNQRYAEMYALPPALTQPGVRWSDIVAHRMETIGYRGLALADVVAQHEAIDLKRVATSNVRELADGRTVLVRHQPIAEGGWVATHEDITERQNVEKRLSHMVRHDSLTGLSNRLHFHEQLETAVADLQHGGRFAVLCIDLDHFKEANDALGHAIGDAVLREVAARLRFCVREVDTAARIGGDEFAIVQVGVGGTDEPRALAERVLEVLAQPFDVERHQIHIGASIGIALAPRDESVGSLLLRMADIALYRAKAEKRQTYRFFEPAMDSELQTRRRLEIDLRKALADDEFEVYFQPINDANTKAIRSFEALVRWRHPERGMISPAEFIPVAEQTGLIVPLGEWVLRTACAEAMRWPADVRVSVNLSASQFKAGNLTQIVRKALADAGLSARRLECEITESVLLDIGADNLSVLHELRGMGARIAMDDFGTGYSSLSYLRSFPFDKIKIDQSFVRNIDQRDAREIVRAVAGLGWTLGITTTAEGVETEEQLRKMIAYRCTEVQGYLFSRPVPGAQARRLLEASRQSREVA